MKKVWDMQPSEVEKLQPLALPDLGQLDPRFSPDGKRLVLSRWESSVFVWELDGHSAISGTARWIESNGGASYDPCASAAPGRRDAERQRSHKTLVRTPRTCKLEDLVQR